MKSILLNRKSMIVDILIGVFVFIIMMLVSLTGHSQNIGINNPTPHAKSLLDLTATDKGLLTPRMTQAQRLAMFSAADPTAAGMLVYQTDLVKGFYYYDGVTWQFLTNGTTGWSLSGNAGTSSPTNFLGTTDNQDLTIKTNNNPAITITKNGRTRIGTPAPVLTLGTERVEIADSNGAKSDLVFVTGGGDPSTKGYPQIVFDKSRNTNIAPTTVQNGDWTGVLVGRGYDGANYANNSAIIFGVDGPVSTGNVPGNIQFQTSAGGNAEKVRISNLGNVGIGNSNPLYPLSFASTIGDKICLWGGAGNHYGMGIQGNLFQIHSANAVDDIAFGYGSSAAFTENMRITGTGNVGMGTSAPYAKLQVISNSGAAPTMVIQNQFASGFAGMWLQGNSNTNMAHFGYANPSAPVWANMAYAGSIASIPFVLTTSDQERIRIDANGNVGIGATSPSAKLEVNGTMKITDGSQGLGKVLTSDANGLASWQTASAANLGGWSLTGNAGTSSLTNFMGTTDNQDVVFKSNNSETMRIKPSGKINISTNNTPPMYGGARVAIADENGNNSDIEIRVAAGSYGQLVLDQTGGTLASPAPSANGQLTGVVVGRSYDGSSLINSGAMIIAVDSAVAPGVMRGNIQFHTAGGSQAEKMRISKDGNVGIGTNIPWLRLHVEGNAPGVPVSYIRNQNAAGYSGTIFGSNAANMAHIGYGNPSAPAWANLAYAGSIANIPFVLTTNDQERVRIDAAGNVGIGNNNPLYPLSFNSTIGDKICLWGAAGNHYGIGIQSNLMQIHSANSVDDIAFGYGSSAAFTENMRITGTGNVGIGTSAPYAKLQVISNSGVAPTFVIQNQLASGFAGMWLQGTGNTNMAHFGYANPSAPLWANQAYAGSIASIPFVLTTADQERVRIDATGNVGIGTTAPSAKLEVNGTMKITDGSQGAGKVLTSDGTGLASWQMLTASSIGGWGLFGNTGTNPLTNFIGTSDATDLAIRTNNNDRVRVKSTGEVGIGTTTPWLMLHVEANAAGVPVSYLRNQNAAGYSGTIFGSNAANMAHIGYGNPSAPAWANVAYAGSIASIPFVLTTNDQERMRIDATGKVGIGTTTPTADLEVNGYTKLGSNAPAIKMIEFTGTTAATQGGSVNVAHGLNSSKILSVDVLVEYTAGSFVHHSYTWTAGYDFSFFINPTNVVVANTFTNSSQILSKPFKMLVTYMQ